MNSIQYVILALNKEFNNGIPKSVIAPTTLLKRQDIMAFHLTKGIDVKFGNSPVCLEESSNLRLVRMI
ncbi:MAG: hypothetical protein ACL7BU_10750 [Candidatus Phlomobacter fragariae]